MTPSYFLIQWLRMITSQNLSHGDSLQYVLSKIMGLKPIGSIERLMTVLLPQADKIIVRRPRSFHKNGPEIYLLTEGGFGLHRRADDLQMSMAKAPHIFGLAELVIPVGNTTYVKFSAESEVYALSGAKARGLLDENPILWRDVSRVLAFHLHFSTWRDLHLLNGNAYDTIRGKLMEMEMHGENLKETTTILNYILRTTKLSRSTILRVMKDLTDGGYVEAQRGKLIRIIHLPLRY
ncbi:helix-turn-helix domain-containing protein [Klebsiella sp. CN_Kp098]|uniref:helix-turn-helix domain-containing protein n=1 Tax=unclassified Klebsiella TaxID=2608929 RepID=UPI0032B476B2